MASTYLHTPPPPLPPLPGSAGRRLSRAPSLMLAPPASSHGTGDCPGRCRGAQLSHRRGGSIPSASLGGKHNVTIPVPILLLPSQPHSTLGEAGRCIEPSGLLHITQANNKHPKIFTSSFELPACANAAVYGTCKGFFYIITHLTNCSITIPFVINVQREPATLKAP